MFLSPGINFDEQKDDIHSVYSEIAPSEIQKFTSSINSNFQNENEKEEDEDNRHIFKSSLEEREQKEDNHCISDKEIFLKKNLESFNRTTIQFGLIENILIVLK